MRLTARPDIDLLSGELFGETAARAYMWMREHEPVYRDETNGLWGIATYDGVLRAGRDAATFSSAGGSRPDTGPLPWMIDLDAPDHHKRRKLVSRGFTPARVRDSEPRFLAICDELIDAVCEQGECDLVHDLAAPLPLIVIGDMLGVAPEERGELLRWSDAMIGSLSGEPERIEAAAIGFGDFVEYAHSAIAVRRDAPTDDLISVLVHAEVDGDRLSDDEIVFESLLLLVGGDETTRHVISGGIDALLRHADQRQKLVDSIEVMPSAVEEMLRWVTPIKNMARTVTRDVEMDGAQLKAGEKVVLLYESANYDESHFGEPTRFDIERSPNDHLAFGFGEHFCLGASLARLEISTMVRRILERLPDLELATDESPERFLGALTSLPVRFTPTNPRAKTPT